MRTLLGLVMILNAALFVFGAVQHAGVAIGPFHEPYIIHATIVETICALALLCGALAVLGQFNASWGVAITGNLIALGGVLLGMVALAMGAGPRTASNDLYHRIMLVLIAVGLIILFTARTAVQRR
jgi:hypothetical protein